MSTSSSTPARERPDSPSPQDSPFPYADAGGRGAAAEIRTTSVQPQTSLQEPNPLQQMEALALARAQGLNEGRAEMSAAMARERERITKALGDFAAERAHYYRRIEAEVVQLALAVARKILHREAQLDPHALAGIVRVTIESMDTGTKISLHLPPPDVTEWRHYFAGKMEGDSTLEVKEDPALGPGECRIETALGATEVGFESQLKEIETGLLDLLAERPGSS